MPCCSITLFSSTNRITLTTSLVFGAWCLQVSACDKQALNLFTPPKTNILHLKITHLETENHLPHLHFLVPCQLSVEYLKPLMERQGVQYVQRSCANCGRVAWTKKGLFMWCSPQMRCFSESKKNEIWTPTAAVQWPDCVVQARSCPKMAWPCWWMSVPCLKQTIFIQTMLTVVENLLWRTETGNVPLNMRVLVFIVPWMSFHEGMNIEFENIPSDKNPYWSILHIIGGILPFWFLIMMIL